MAKMIKTTPLQTQQSVRLDEWRGLTSARAGDIRPIAFFPLLRQDRLRGTMTVQVKMAEAVDVILNPVRVTVQAHLVPKISLDRFQGSMETLNRSYMGENLPSGDPSPPWYVKDMVIPTLGNDDKGSPFYDSLGVHYDAATEFNTDVVESYRAVVNWRRRAMSSALPDLVLTDHALAPAFWDSSRFEYIKPSFDAAMMEGAVEMAISGMLPVKGLGIPSSEYTTPNGSFNLRQTFAAGETPATKATTGLRVSVAGTPNAGEARMAFEMNGSYPAIFADASGTSVVMSLANLNLAKQTQGFAKAREQYRGIPDQYLIDLLMAGIPVPPEDLREPILIGRATAVIGMQQRFATDGASLDQSVANGIAALNMTLNTQTINTGGVVIVTAEIVPEQLFERVEDLSLLYPAGGVASGLPEYVRDFLDPQKVEVVPNSFADNLHADPAGIFGYAPMNHRWQRSFARVGGRFKRPVPDSFVEDRQRIWSVETPDPSLAEDFYICPQPFPHSVFADTASDPFELVTIARCEIVGNTVFGAGFEEYSGEYDRIMSQVDAGRLESPESVSGNEAPAEVPSETTDKKEGAA